MDFIDLLGSHDIIVTPALFAILLVLWKIDKRLTKIELTCCFHNRVKVSTHEVAD